MGGGGKRTFNPLRRRRADTRRMPDPALDLDFARWARARDDYRAGLTAAEVCARHGIGRSAFYARAQAERWRRADLPSNGAAPPQEDDFDADRPRASAAGMAEQAHRRLAHALDKGRLREALGWSRLARDLRQLAEAEEASSWRRLRAAQREDEAQTAATAPVQAEATAPDERESEAERGRSPACDSAQCIEGKVETAPRPDCPDVLNESAAEAEDLAELEALPLEVLRACREIMRREPDSDRAWTQIAPLLEAARPDIAWRGGGVEDEPFDEEAFDEPAFSAPP